MASSTPKQDGSPAERIQRLADRATGRRSSGTSSEHSIQQHEQLLERDRQSQLEVQRQQPIPVQLPFWSDLYRCEPNEIVRSSLFSASKGPRRFFDSKTRLCVVGDGEIFYLGPELRLEEEDVFMELLHLFRGKSDENYIDIRPGAFLRQLDIKRNANAYIRLRERLGRLNMANLTIRSKRLNAGITLNLVRKFAWQGDDGHPLSRWRVWIEPEIQSLFESDQYTKIDRDLRRQLSHIGKRIHAFLASHRNPYPMKAATLQAMCALQGELKQFRARLKEQLNIMQAAGFLEAWCIDEYDRIQVKRTNKKALPQAEETL